MKLVVVEVIRTHAAEKISSKFSKTEKLRINTFNSHNQKLVNTQVTEIFIFGKPDHIRKIINTVNDICDLPTDADLYQCLIKKYNIDDLFVGGKIIKSEKIDIPFGSELGEEVIESVKNLYNHVYVLNTSLGLVLTGITDSEAPNDTLYNVLSSVQPKLVEEYKNPVEKEDSEFNPSILGKLDQIGIQEFSKEKMQILSR